MSGGSGSTFEFDTSWAPMSGLKSVGSLNRGIRVSTGPSKPYKALERLTFESGLGKPYKALVLEMKPYKRKKSFFIKRQK